MFEPIYACIVRLERSLWRLATRGRLPVPASRALIKPFPYCMPGVTALEDASPAAAAAAAVVVILVVVVAVGGSRCPRLSTPPLASACDPLQGNVSDILLLLTVGRRLCDTSTELSS